MITKILFVTKTLNTKEELQRLGLSYKKSMEFFFAESGTDALKIICENDIAIAVSDLRIPKFDQNEFLNLLQNNFPKVFRVCLSSSNEKEKAIGLSKSIHRLVKLPLNHEELLKTINDLAILIRYDLDALLVEKINGLGAIPILPDIYLRLGKEISRPTFSMHRIAEIIQSDPLMVARILHIAHSSFFNIPTGVTNLLQALNFLGVDIIKTLVLYVKIFTLKNVSAETQSMLKEIKAHSINVAKLSKAIMEKETDDKKLIETAYIAGLLHDIGKIIILQMNDKQKHTDYSQKINTSLASQTEIDLFGISHVSIGSYVLRLWGFNDEIIEAVSSHHDSTMLDSKTLTLKEAVFIANIFSQEMHGMSESISKSFGAEKFDQWDQLFKDDIRPYLNLSI